LGLIQITSRIPEPSATIFQPILIGTPKFEQLSTRFLRVAALLARRVFGYWRFYSANIPAPILERDNSVDSHAKSIRQ
jgi:hypothetical protein